MPKLTATQLDYVYARLNDIRDAALQGALTKHWPLVYATNPHGMSEREMFEQIKTGRAKLIESTVWVDLVNAFEFEHSQAYLDWQAEQQKQKAANDAAMAATRTKLEELNDHVRLAGADPIETMREFERFCNHVIAATSTAE